MLSGCTVFNQPLANWNVSNVLNFDSLFSGCRAFNRPLTNWNVRKGETFYSMIGSCDVFNQPLNNWRPGIDSASQRVEVISMFSGATAFIQNIASWPFALIRNMNNMFFNATSFNQNLSSWIMRTDTERQAYDQGATAWIAGNKPQFTLAP